MHKFISLFLLILAVFVSGCISDEPGPTGYKPELTTGVDTVCESNDDCWCQSFNGVQFFDEKIPSFCHLDTNRCTLCVYK